MEIQSVIFPKNLFDENKANEFLNKKELKKIKPFHETKNFYRARLKNPIGFKYFRTIRLPNGVEMIIGHK